MKKDTLLRCLPRGIKADSALKNATELYNVGFKAYTKDYKGNLHINDRLKITIWRTVFETYIVGVWDANKCDAYCNEYLYRQYATLKEAWTYKRTRIKNWKKKFTLEMIEEWNRDSFKNEDWRK